MVWTDAIRDVGDCPSGNGLLTNRTRIRIASIA